MAKSRDKIRLSFSVPEQESNGRRQCTHRWRGREMDTAALLRALELDAKVRRRQATRTVTANDLISSGN